MPNSSLSAADSESKFEVRSLLQRLFDPLTLFLTLVALLPVWYFDYFPTQDGPAHIENGLILLNWNNPSFKHLHQYYEINPNFDPTWGGRLLLVSLLYLFPPVIAEKILISSLFILAPLMVRVILLELAPANAFLAALIIPCLYSVTLFLGFYDMFLGLIAGFFVLYTWLKVRERKCVVDFILLSISWLVLYGLHIFSFLLTGLVLIIFEFGLLIFERRRIDRTLLKELLFLGWSVVVPIILVVSFLGRHLSSQSWSVPKTELLEFLLVAGPITASLPSSGAWIRWIILTLFALLFLYSICTQIILNKQNLFYGGWILILVLVCIYFTIPNQIGTTSFIALRFSTMIMIFSVFVFSGSYYGTFLRSIVQLSIAVLVIALVYCHFGRIGKINDLLDEFYSISTELSPGSTYLELSFDHFGIDPVDGSLLAGWHQPFLHASSTLASRHKLINLANYEATMGYFPVRYQNIKNPYYHLGSLNSLEDIPPRINIEQFEGSAHDKIDFIGVWGLTSDFDNELSKIDSSNIFPSQYELIHTSKPLGLHKLYRRKADEPNISSPSNMPSSSESGSVGSVPN